MTTDSPLIQSARVVATARADLERISSRFTELRERSRDLDELKSALADARERRAQLLEEALLNGTKANTDEADKAVDKALRALQRREDEITAVERALATLEGQRQTAQAALDEATNAYHEARASLVLGRLDGQLVAIRKAAEALGQRINEGRTLLERIEINSLPAEARPWFAMQRSHYGAHIDNLQSGISVVLSNVRGHDAKAMSALDAELAEAHKLTGAVDDVSKAMESAEYVHADGSVHSEPEAREESVRTVGMRDTDAPGMVYGDAA